MVKINIGLTLGKNKKQEAPVNKGPVERRCSVCGNYTTTTSDRCPKCQSRL